MDGFIDYLRELIDDRRAHPSDDIPTGLIHASEDGDSLSDDEVIAMVFMLITAGYETTHNLITNSVATLLTHPDQLDLLNEQPALVDSAVEELLRYTGTVGGTEATTFGAEDITLHAVYGVCPAVEFPERQLFSHALDLRGIIRAMPTETVTIAALMALDNDPAPHTGDTEWLLDNCKQVAYALTPEELPHGEKAAEGWFEATAMVTFPVDSPEAQIALENSNRHDAAERFGGPQPPFYNPPVHQAPVHWWIVEH